MLASSQPNVRALTAAAPWLALALIAAIDCIKIGAGSLWDNSEPQYGEIVKEMLHTGDWLTLHKDFVPWFIHPPLWFWTASVSAKAFGLNEFALRIPSAVFGVLCGVATYLAGRRMYGRTAGIVAVLALGASLEFIVLSRLAVQDTMLVFFTTVATLWSYFAVRDQCIRDLRLATIAAALGTLVKGPVALVLPLATLLVYLTWKRRWATAAKLPWLSAAGVYLLIAGSWFAAETFVNGPQFLAAYFGASNVSRYLTPFENQPGPWYYYVPVVVAGFLPFIAYVPQAIARAWRSKSDHGVFLISAIAVPLVFFSVAQTKLPNYIAVIFPAMAIFVGDVFASAIEVRSMRPLRVATVSLVVTVAAASVALAVYGRSHLTGDYAALIAPLGALALCVALIAVATLIISMILESPWIVAWGMTAMMAALIGIAAFFVLPRVEVIAKPMKPMAAVVMQHWHSGDRICYESVHQGFSLAYYTQGSAVAGVGYGPEDMLPTRFFRFPQAALCVVSPSAYADLRTRRIDVAPLDRTKTLILIYKPRTLR